MRTENIAGGGRVIIKPVAAATRYRVELSKDGGSTWVMLDEKDSPELNVSGLTNFQASIARLFFSLPGSTASSSPAEAHNSRPA